MFTYEEIMSLNELEMNVYQYILKNKEKAVYMKIRELAEEAHVSTTTVLRWDAAGIRSLRFSSSCI